MNQIQQFFILLFVFTFFARESVCDLKQPTRFKFNSANKQFSNFQPPQITRAFKRNFKLLFLFGLISVEASAEIFVRLPQEIVYGSKPSILPPVVKKNLLLIFPGAGGPDKNTDALRTKIISSDRSKRVDRSVLVYDWTKWRGNIVRASFDGQAVGRTVCSNLAKDEEKNGYLESVHVIGISVGAFAADSCVKAYKDESAHPAPVRLTLLDPFTSKGIFGYAWGQRNFGKQADIAEDYLNRDDPVPTTNSPLPLAYTFDVTESKKRVGFTPLPGDSMHSWPVVYLAQQWKTEADSHGRLKLPGRDLEPPGVVYKAP